jgi:hypothetical protein
MLLRRATTICASALTLALAACGGDAATTPTAPPFTQTTPPPATESRTAPERPRESGGSPRQGGGSPAPEDRTREAEADYEKYCETHPGACAD